MYTINTQKALVSLVANIFVLGGLVAAFPSQAAILIGNLPQNNDRGVGSLSSVQHTAVSFTLPSGKDYKLEKVIMRLTNYTDTVDSPIVEIRDDSGGAYPGSNVLVRFITPPSQGQPEEFFNYNFMSNSSFTFMADTKYWLYAYDALGISGWAASIPRVAPTGIATFGSSLSSIDAGVSWEDSFFGNSFQIVTTSEFSSPLSLLAIGIGGAALTLKRKLKNSESSEKELEELS